MKIRDFFAGSLATFFAITLCAWGISAYAYTNLYVGGSGTVTVVPTLQQVTTAGNSTNNDITVNTANATNSLITNSTSTNFAVTGSATSTMGLAAVSSTAFVSDKGCANGHGFLFGGDQSTGMCSNTANTLKLITAGITRMQISSSGWTAVNNNVLDIGTINTAMRDIYTSGTIRGDQVYLGEDNTATSTLRVGRAGFNGGCIAISDDDKSGTTYCVGHNGTLTCSTTSCE